MRSNFESVQLGSEEYLQFRDYLKQVAGIDLGNNKQYLVSTRIRRILLEYHCSTLAELTALIKKSSSYKVRQKVIDVMTTNETFWFRDIYPFDYLKSTVLPELHKAYPTGRLRIWSAACSSGQEPYSLSMIAEEYIKANFAIKNINLEIIATDLSSEILDQAKAGAYDRLSVARGLSSERLRDYFDPVDGECWQAKPKIRQRISFRPLNLQDSYAVLGKFDVICCRNVLIYFSADLKKKILTRLHASLRPNAVLFLGASESLAGASDLFDMVHCNPGVMYRAKSR
ncbi:MAG: chemotaxis protein methyltransferase CheR [Lentisphaeria bacterium]|jgi:chemotaxis protein methyltransferase CheR